MTLPWQLEGAHMEEAHTEEVLADEKPGGASEEEIGGGDETLRRNPLSPL